MGGRDATLRLLGDGMGWEARAEGGQIRDKRMKTGRRATDARNTNTVGWS